jgi:exonuclease SbcC
LEEHQQRQALLAADHAATSAFAETLANEIAAIEQDLIHAGTNLEAIGFYEESLRRLTSEQPAAIRLQSERLQLARVREQAQQVEASAVKLDGAAEAAGRTACQEEAAAASAREHMEGAEEALRTAEAEHAAAHLRTGLRPGNACPVCRQEVSQVPTEQTPPELNQVHQACGAAKSRLTSAERNAAQAAKAFAAASATADAARTRASSSRSELDHRQQDFAHKEQALLEKVGDLLDPSSPAPVEEQALAAGQAASARHALYLQAAQRLNELQTQLALKKKDCESRSGQIARLDADLRATMAKIAVAREALIAVRNEIYLAAGTDEPAAEAERLQAEIALLEAAVARTTQAERTASERLRLAEASMNNCAQEASQASAHAAAVWATTAIALQKSGFTDAGAARAAHRPASQIRTMRERITAYEAISRALDHRIAELETALQGRRVSAAECLPAEQALEACVQRRKVAETQAAVFGQQLQHMQGRLERAKQLREELAEQEQLHHIYDRLAHDLRNDQFQAYLLEETLIGLLSNASCQLSRLTGERYGLLFRDERIIVIDHDNAGECRGIDTLSGGELFLASLALALALSEQVQKAAGAVHLDCLFIDEGFGTLDPETLRTVSDAIRGLQVGGRMVGIITHVPELKDEFEQQIIVEKQDGTSCVH